MEPGLAIQFITGLPREMPLSFYFTGDSPGREPQLKRSPFPPARLAGAARDPPASRCEALRAGGGQVCAET